MVYFPLRSIVTVLLATSAAACVSVSQKAGEERVKALVQASGAASSGIDVYRDRTTAADRTREVLAAPLTPQAAIELSFLNNPRMASDFAQLQLSQSDVVAASRLQNPVVSGSRTDGGGSHISVFAISQNLSSLILLSVRKRFASGNYERALELAASSIINLSADVEQAWLRYVGSEQVAAMRALIATNAETSSDLAERFNAAGNISELDLALEHSAAAQARIAAIRAGAEATRSKFVLHQLMGLTGEPSWKVTQLLPAPIETTDALDALLATAHTRRGDLVAANHEVMLLDDALHLAKRWRWLGSVDVGVEHDREQDGVRLTGPTISLALPIFDQGQTGISRAEGQLAAARSRLSALEVEIDNGVRFNFARVDAARAVATQYSKYLNPAQEIIGRRQQQRQNFMFIGEFELLLTKQQQYDAYQSYLEAVGDYWLARSDLARATGGTLPSDAAIPPATIGVTPLDSPAEQSVGDMPGMPGMDHSAHTGNGDTMAPPQNLGKPDEHARHATTPADAGEKR